MDHNEWGSKFVAPDTSRAYKIEIYAKSSSLESDHSLEFKTQCAFVSVHFINYL